jgi:2-polyprenyl-3-methyl-5-hydroxy-6-metoxy-1,4-benzoquinol methylase
MSDSSLLHRAIAHILGSLPADVLQDGLAAVATRRARTLPPADGLRFLFNLDAALYPVQGDLAVAYGGGVHTKHRLTHYHNFFVSRIRAGERVLDIGCGIGAVAHDVAEHMLTHAWSLGLVMP